MLLARKAFLLRSSNDPPTLDQCRRAMTID
jgi:hypothetical protein